MKRPQSESSLQGLGVALVRDGKRGQDQSATRRKGEPGGTRRAGSQNASPNFLGNQAALTAGSSVEASALAPLRARAFLAGLASESALLPLSPP